MTEKEPETAPVAAVETTPAAPETVTVAECEKRVSGMQSAMAKQLDALKADYEAKLADVRDTAAAAANDFKNQLAAKDEELTKASAEVTRLTEAVRSATDEVAKVKGELSETASALEAKTKALATLNASVNAPAAKADAWTLAYREARASRNRKHN